MVYDLPTGLHLVEPLCKMNEDTRYECKWIIPHSQNSYKNISKFQNNRGEKTKTSWKKTKISLKKSKFHGEKAKISWRKN